MAFFLATRMELTSGLVHFLSNEGDRELASLSSSLANSPITRGMVLVISSNDVALSLAAAAEWKNQLSSHPEVEKISSGPDPKLTDEVRTLYFERRFAFITNQPEYELMPLLEDKGLRRSALRLRETLNLPEGALFKKLAPADPLLLFRDLLERFRSAQTGSLDVVDGQFAEIDSKRAVLFLTTIHSPFASSHQVPLDVYLLNSFAALNENYQGELNLERAGVHAFSVSSERSATRDANRIGLFSVLGIIFLFVVLFRSLKLLAITLLPLAGGLLTAATGSLLLFGELHLMTVVFGATLLGVCLDYPIHYACFHTMLPAKKGLRESSSSIKRVWGPIAMGGATTLAGFVGLAWAEFPGIREIGIFSALGIAGALATTRGLLPAIMPPGQEAPLVQKRVAQKLTAALERIGERRLLVFFPFAIAALVCIVGLPQLSWDDDVFSLSIPIDPERLQEDRRVRNLVSQMDSGRFIVAFGADDEKALRVNDAVYSRLAKARDAGVIDDFRSLHTFLTSEALQQENLRVFSQAPDLASRTLAALQSEGFRPEAFAEFTQALEAEPPPPLRIGDLTGSALSDLVAPFRIHMPESAEQTVAYLTFLKGVNDSTALSQTLAGLPNARLFDQREFLRDIYREYRERTSVAIAFGLLAVTSLLALRYRNAKVAFTTSMPAIFAATTTLGLLSLCGIEVNLIHLLGLLLVLSIGVDYSIFLVSAQADPQEKPATLLSLSIACTSTCLSFGLLSLSSFPALHALGIVTGTGTLLSLLFALLILADGKRQEERP